jgi:hypothetical protein
MRNFLAATLMLASTAFAFASDVTVLTTTLPATRGYTTVDTGFYIDTEMKEAYAEIEVDEQITVSYQDCSYNGGYYGGGRYGGPVRGGRYGRPYPGQIGRPFPGNICRTATRTESNTILSNKVKIEGVTMNGDDVIYQGAEGDVVCGTMGRSRVFRVPTFYLSGNCSLQGKISELGGVKQLTVKLIVK